VTLWIGIAITFSTVWVSMSVVALMFGRSCTSRSLMRILTRKLVTSSELEAADWEVAFVPTPEEPISVTLPENLRAG